MSFLSGLKDSLKMDQLTGAAASKFQGAKEFLNEKTETGPLKQMKDQAADMAGKAGGAVQSLGLSKYLPMGGGKRQSPIDIVTSEAKFDDTLGDGQIVMSYVAAEAKQLVNSGYSLQVNFQPGGKSSVTASYLPGTYILKQVHIHVGTEPMNGSEHLIGGVGYAGEAHLVHVNEKYGELEDALKHPDGVAIMAAFLNVSVWVGRANLETHDDNKALQSVIGLLGKVSYVNDYMPLDRGFDARALMPDKMEFWTYEGSLTTPPLSECATWTVFRASVPISSLQLENLRNLYAVTADQAVDNPAKIAGNNRPVQPTNGRLIRASFRAGGIIDQ